MIEDCTAVILTGGESRRMGRDKALAELDGRPLLQHVIDSLRPLFGRLVVSVRKPRPGLCLPQIRDAWPGRGPMTGIASVMQRVDTDWLFVAGCDMPFIEPGLVRLMADRRDGHDAVLAETGGHMQPLPGFYARRILPAMRARIAEGRRSLTGLIADEPDVALLSEAEARNADPDLRSFTDFDTQSGLDAVVSGRICSLIRPA